MPGHRGRSLTRERVVLMDAKANRGVGFVANVFAVNRGAIHWSRALVLLFVTLVPFAVLWAVGQEQYFLSAAFGAVFMAAADPGGAFGYRASHLAVYALAGAVLTAVGFALGGGDWGWVALAAFVVTLAAGLAARFGAHRFLGAELLNVWFIVALAIADSNQRSHTASHTWAQAVAWLAGGALWLVVVFVAWLARGREDRSQPLAELPSDTQAREMSRPLIMYAVIRAIAIAITVTIAWGLDLPHADWMPVAAIVAMKPRLDEAKLTSEQRFAGAFIGAVISALLLLTVKNEHALELITIGFLTVAFAIRFANYAFYCAAIATAVLIALDLPNPTNFTAEAERVLYTFIGLAVGLLVMLLAGLIAKRTAKPPTPAALKPA